MLGDSEGKMKKKRLNKNKKKNWRKNIDISAIEESLEIQRLELRTGGIISEKKNDEIFFIDKIAHDKTLLEKKRRRNRTLKVDRIIVPDLNAVKPASRTRRKVKLRTQKTLEKKLDRKAKAMSNTVPEIEEAPFDLWANESLDLYDKETKKTTTVKHAEYIRGQRRVKRPRYLENDPSDVQGYKYRKTPAVEVAHPGASYNPTYRDHQNLLQKAHLIEVEKLRAKEKIEKALHVPYDELPDVGANEKEMQEGLFETKDEEEQEDEEETPGVMQNPPVRAGDRKTRRKRRMEEKEKREKLEREKTWGNKLRENEVFRTKTFLAEIKAKEKKIAARRELRKKKVRMLTLSNVKFSEQDVELKLSDEIKGSLRELKPEPGLLTDRYKSFQKRGIVEPRCKRRVPKRKRKIKYQEKRPWREIED